MVNKGWLFFLLFTLSSFSLWAQQEASYWFFYNNAGLKFTPGKVEAVTNGQVAVEPTYSNYATEGSATISNEKGNLLFYTDGLTVWNQDHQIMPHGTDLAGHWSSTQSALIVPKPGSEKLFYIFTTDERSSIAPPSAGLRYSLVDLSLANGKGDVLESTKNTLLFADAAEKLTAVRHSNGQDIWVISQHRQGNRLSAYQVTKEGVSTNAVPSLTGPANVEHNDPLGYLKASPDGRMLASAKQNSGRLETYRFNPATGLVSGGQTLRHEELAAIYGVEFSPDGRLLYVSSGGSVVDGPPARVFQLNLEAGSLETIFAARVLLKSYPATYDLVTAGALQLAPDGKIYFAKQRGYLDAISQPNVKGLDCKFVENAIYLKGKESSLGLPNFPAYYFFHCENLSLDLGRDTTLCVGQPFVLDPGFPHANLRWSDGSSGATLRVTTAGTYFVQATVYGCVVTDTICISYHPAIKVDLGPDRVICPGEPILLQAFEPGATYRWSNGSTAPSLVVTRPGHYWLEVNKEGRCPVRDSITIQPNSPLVFTLGENKTLCLGEKLWLEVPLTGLSYRWNTGTTASNLLVTASGIYRVTVSNGCETVEKAIEIRYENCNCDLELTDIITPNEDGKNEKFIIPTHQNIQRIRLEIYNRWGVKLFEQIQPGKDWDGQGADEGVYFYLLRYDCQQSGRSVPKTKKGTITLVR